MAGRLQQQRNCTGEWEKQILDVRFRIVARCTSWLRMRDRLKEEGIFRVSGSVKRIKELFETLEEEESGGSRRADLDASDIHTVGGVLKKTLIAIEPPLVPDEVFQALQQAQFSGEADSMLGKYRAALSGVPPLRLEILKHTFDFLRDVVRVQEQNRMNAQNVCRVFSATLLRGTDEMTSTLFLASGRLPTIALTLLVSDVLLDTSFDPSTLAPPPADRLLEILRGEEEKFQQMQRQGSGRSIKVGPAAKEEAAVLLQGGQRRPSRDWVSVDGEAGNSKDALDELTQTVGGIFGGVSSLFMNPFSIFGKGKASSAASSPVGSPISGNLEEVSPQKEAKEKSSRAARIKAAVMGRSRQSMTTESPARSRTSSTSGSFRVVDEGAASPTSHPTTPMSPISPPAATMTSGSWLQTREDGEYV